jgi:DNA-binding CsgD family transcriptional regulator
MFNGLTVNYAFKSKKIKVFTTLKAYSNNKTSVRANITSSSINFHLYLYKKTNLKKKH